MGKARTETRTQFTDVVLRNLPIPASGQVQYADGKLPGFGVRVSSSGAKMFYLSYRVYGRSRRLMIGRYPYVSLADARAKAHEALSALEKNTDPQGQKTNDAGFTTTVGTFVETHCKRHNRPATATETERLLRTVFVPRWHERPLETIKRGDVVAVLDALVLADTPSAANHAFAAIRKFFNWCVARGRLEVSPCYGLGLPAKASSRDRVLTDHELSTLWRAAGTMGYPFGTIFQLLALTGQRRGEVLGMAWRELDLKQGLWTMPGSRTKNGEAHLVPLTPAVVEILKLVPRKSPDLVFPARGMPDTPFVGTSTGKRELDATADLHDWTLHDLRRTAATGMARLGVFPHVVERILNHVSGSFGGVAGVYNRFQYVEEMRAALTLWADHIARLAAEPSETESPARKPIARAT